MINKTTTYPTITTIKFFIIAIAALAAAMSLAAASQKIKRKKKTSSLSGISNFVRYGATGSSGQPGAGCKKTSFCVILLGLDHAVCHDCRAIHNCSFATRLREVTKLCML